MSENPTAVATSSSLSQLCINTIRTLAMDAVEKATSGHPGTPMEAASLAYVLWMRHLRFNPENPFWPGRDRFILSAGHASMLLYSTLYLTGYDIALDELKNFRQFGSRTPGHPERHAEIGIETTTGPLGQGFGNGVGMAIALRYLSELYTRPGFEDLFDNRVYAFCSDGDIQEGVSHEAAAIAGHLGLGNLIYVYLDNRITIEGSTDLSMSEDVEARYRAYHWHVQRVEGNDLQAIDEAFTAARAETGRPSLIIARTHIAFGSPHKQDTAEAHGAPLGGDEVIATKKNLGWPSLDPFYVPQEALEHFRGCVGRGQELEQEWDERWVAYREAHPEPAAECDRIDGRQLPEGWDSGLPSYTPGDGALATRNASGDTINILAQKLPEMIGGSADLAPSNNTIIKGGGDFARVSHGRNLHFGVREHAMGAILNGIAFSTGLIPYGGTFLIFADYMRPTIRLAAMSEDHVIYVFTHDSIGLGEDGPTHQPIEHLASLRAIPGLTLIRPSDANETVEAWKVAIRRENGPVALVLTRQKLPVIDREVYPSASLLARGAYVLADSSPDPEVILIATGSEVSVALEAHTELAAKGVRSRLVAMPSWELFSAQPEEYQIEVLPPGVTKRVAVEAASPMGWERWVGAEGLIIAIDRFGASAPGEVVLSEYGFTKDNIVARTLAYLPA